MKQRKVYDREFKENAVKLSYERDNMTQFARELGISVSNSIVGEANQKLGSNTESVPNFIQKKG